MKSYDDICNRFQYHCISPEESNNPLIPQIIQFGKIIHRQNPDHTHTASIGIRYGKRLLINNKNAPIDNIERKDIIEIIDVDPAKKTILYLGSSEPSKTTPLLYMIGYAKREVQYIVSLNIAEKANHIDSFPIVSIEKTFLDLLKSILKQLQKHDIILVNNTIMVLVAQTEKQIKKRLNEVSVI